MLQERRKFKRLDIYHVIEIKSDVSLLGITRNFSYQGFCFELDSIDFESKKNIEFNLKYPQNNLKVSFTGDVIWEKRISNKFLAGIKLGKMDKEIQGKLIEMLSAISDEEKSVEVFSENNISGRSTNRKRKLMRKFIIGLSISFFILSGVITFKALRIPVSKNYYQTTPKQIDPKEHLPKSENILKKPVKEQVDSRILDEDALSNKDKETQNIDNKSIIQVKSDNDIETKNILNKTLNADNKQVSQLVYTIQIESRSKIEDAQKQFNFMLGLINDKNLNLFRIEKIGKYYTLRLGRFENYENAEKLLQEINPPLSEAIILKAHIMNERIIRSYE